MFDAMDIISVPRDQNNLADSLVVAASTHQPSEDLIKGEGKLEIIFRPSVPDNVDHWQVFRDDKQILRFIHNVQEFSDFNVSYKEEGKDYPEEDDSIKNPSPRGITTLEKIFDMHDMHKKKKEVIKPGSYIEVNIGTEEAPRLIKIGKGTSEKERKQLISLQIRLLLAYYIFRCAQNGQGLSAVSVVFWEAETSSLTITASSGGRPFSAVGA
jgi:hypothetical protein